MRGRRTTDVARERIRELTIGGMEQQKIAVDVGLSRSTIWKVQRQLQLRQHVPNRQPVSASTQNKITAMLRQAAGRIRIARELGVSLETIDRIARRIRFRRRRGSPGIAYRLRKPEIARIREAITESEKQLCKRFHVSRWWLRRFRAGLFSRRRK
jgi:uncharacterized protein YerC